MHDSFLRLITKIQLSKHQGPAIKKPYLLGKEPKGPKLIRMDEWSYLLILEVFLMGYVWIMFMPTCTCALLSKYFFFFDCYEKSFKLLYFFLLKINLSGPEWLGIHPLFGISSVSTWETFPQLGLPYSSSGSICSLYFILIFKNISTNCEAQGPSGCP